MGDDGRCLDSLARLIQSMMALATLDPFQVNSTTDPPASSARMLPGGVVRFFITRLGALNLPCGEEAIGISE